MHKSLKSAIFGREEDMETIWWSADDSDTGPDTAGLDDKRPGYGICSGSAHEVETKKLLWNTEERKISIASQVIAYLYQILDLDNRVVFISWLMNHYKRDCPHSYKYIACMLGCSELTFRVRVCRIYKKVDAIRKQLMRTGTLPLDGEHIRMSEAIKARFADLSPLFLKYYRVCLFVKTGMMTDFWVSVIKV